MSFRWYLVYVAALTAAVTVAVGLIPNAAAGLATVCGSFAALCALLYTPRKDGQ